MISIIGSKCGNNTVDDWYFKPISNSWYPESEQKLAKLSKEYQQMLSYNTPNHVWVLRNYNTQKIQELIYRLHIIKDIDINEYRTQFDTITIEKVINHKDFMTLLNDSHSNPPN